MNCDMGNLFNASDAAGILSRLEKLTAGTSAQWGKMSVDQAVSHCKVPLQAALGDKQLKRTFMGVIFGKMAKKQLLKEEPFKKNLPTDPNFVIKGHPDFSNGKKELQSLIMRFTSADSNNIAEHPHPFFGKMTAEEWGRLMWKHMDHHLRQFGA